MKVPFLDLKTQYESIKDEIDTAIGQVVEKTAFAGGPFVKKFEEEFADYCGCKHAAGVNSGTSALWLALTGLGIGKGDEVITVPNTFIATAEAISMSGARPVFVDIDEQTYTMNPALLEQAITDRTKAVIPVHLYGQMADMDPIMEIALKYGLFVIEDAAQAHGAEYKGRRAGSIGDAGCFSFYPGKNLGAYGEAGAVVTNNFELVEKINRIKDHGQSKKYYHSMIGWNDRMDGIQGAVLSAKLKHLESWTEARRKNAALYNSLLSDIDSITVPCAAEHIRHVYHIYPVLVGGRDRIIKALEDKQIYCGIHYPVPLHLTEAYKPLSYDNGSFPVTERVAEKLLSLPMFPELTELQIKHVAATLKELIDVSK
jgi:dTDP-4-amino-4,6-dideoxygalactose transaminase